MTHTNKSINDKQDEANISKMMPPNPIIPVFRTINAIVTYNCPNLCRICCTNSKPDSSGLLDIDQYAKFLIQAKKKGFNRVSLTGGDPFTEYERLKEYILIAKENDFSVVLSTSAYWAESKNLVVQRLEELVRIGVTNISISTDRYHQKNVSLERINHFLEGYFSDRNTPMLLKIKQVVTSKDDPLAIIPLLNTENIEFHFKEMKDDSTAVLYSSYKNIPSREVYLHWNGLYKRHTRHSNNKETNFFKVGNEYCNAKDLQIEPSINRFDNNTHEKDYDKAIFRPCCSPGNMAEGLKREISMNNSEDLLEKIADTYSSDPVFRGLRCLGLDFFNKEIASYDSDFKANNICQACQVIYTNPQIYKRISDKIIELENSNI
jgi:pyruvate-formate lyase-activating enzyme